MEEQRDRRMGGWKDTQVSDEWIDVYMGGQMDGRGVDGQIFGSVDGKLGGWMNG